jgi:hypothetical protein
MSPTKAGPRGWYAFSGGAPFLWTGILHPTEPMGLVVKLQIQRHGSGRTQRKLIAVRHGRSAAEVRKITAGEGAMAVEAPTEVDGLDAREAVRRAEAMTTWQ